MMRWNKTRVGAKSEPAYFIGADEFGSGDAIQMQDAEQWQNFDNYAHHSLLCNTK